MHQLALLEVAEPVQQLGHPQRHRGLAGARRAGEAHVQVRPRASRPNRLPRPVHQEQCGDLLHLPLHRGQADQILVQGGQDLVDARRRALVGKGDSRADQQCVGARPGLRRVTARRRADLAGRGGCAAPAVQSCGACGRRTGVSASSSIRRTLTTAAVITVPRATTEVTTTITSKI